MPVTTNVSNAGFTCEHCTTYGTFGLADSRDQRLVAGQRVDRTSRPGVGLIHDPVFHQPDCPMLDPAYKIMRALS